MQSHAFATSATANHCLTPSEFASAFGITDAQLPAQCLATLAQRDFRYTVLSDNQQNDLMREINKSIDNDPGARVGQDRKSRWEAGWQENLNEYLEGGDNNLKALVPKYIKYDVLRYQGRYIQVCDRQFEFLFLRAVVQTLTHLYMFDVNPIIEFGCGTGANLLTASDVFPDKQLIGCDWACSSQKLLTKLAKDTGRNLTAINLNMFEPHDQVPLSSSSGVMTIDALEQLGTGFDPFLQYLLRHRPMICVHLEPLIELYDERNDFDALALRYHRKRGYLSGFLTTLRDLAAAGRVSIVAERRLHFGSLYNEGYSVVAWKPLT
jgi:hypothetical protein